MDKRKLKKGVMGFKRALQGVARTAGSKRRQAAEEAAAAATAARHRPMLQTEEFSAKAAKKATAGGWLDGIGGEHASENIGRDRFFAGVSSSGSGHPSSALRTSTPVDVSVSSPAASVVQRRAAKRSRLADNVSAATYQYVVTNTRTTPAGGVNTAVAGVYSTLALAAKSAATSFTLSSGIASCHARISASTTLSDANLTNGTAITAYSTQNPASGSPGIPSPASTEVQRQGGRRERSGHGVNVRITRVLQDGAPVSRN